ncbi:hypothetical protein D3C85_1365070 [compost metagenome]
MLDEVEGAFDPGKVTDHLIIDTQVQAIVVPHDRMLDRTRGIALRQPDIAARADDFILIRIGWNTVAGTFGDMTERQVPAEPKAAVTDCALVIQ